MTDSLEKEFERLNEDLEHESKIKNALEKSMHDVQLTICELESKLYSEDFDCEWKQRFEEQFSLNENLEKQLRILEEKMKELQMLDLTNPSSKQASKIDDAALRRLIRQLEKENRVLEGKLKDFEWRIDTESQELAKLNEEKSEYKLELLKTEQHMDEVRIKAATPVVLTTLLPGVKFSGRRTPLDVRDRQYGLPNNRRIIDPAKGPVKKTATVKKLPKLETSMSRINTNEKSSKLKDHRKTKSSDDMYLEHLDKIAFDERTNDTA